MNLKKAFSLAEVLITLGVVGIVAALTMPTLIANYQKKVIKTQFAKQYNIIQQSYKLIEQKKGYKPRCFYWGTKPYGPAQCDTYNAVGDCTHWSFKEDGSPLPSNYNGEMRECTSFKEEMKQQLKVVKVCKNNAFSNGCIPKYKGNDTFKRESNPNMSDYDVNKSTAGCGGWRESAIANSREAWVLADGTIILFYSAFQLFAVDVNGKKPPNKWGHDLFPFQTISNVNAPLQLVGGGCGVLDKGGISTDAMIKSLYNRK